MIAKDQETIAQLQIYSFEEAVAASTEYFKGDSLAANVWVNKYALKDSFGNIYEKTPEDMHRRIASEIARIESKYPNPLSEEAAYDLLKDFAYLQVVRWQALAITYRYPRCPTVL
jgi:ribonucleoside-diphosphate reductase alpha chain